MGDQIWTPDLLKYRQHYYVLRGFDQKQMKVAFCSITVFSPFSAVLKFSNLFLMLVGAVL